MTLTTLDRLAKESSCTAFRTTTRLLLLALIAMVVELPGSSVCPGTNEKAAQQDAPSSVGGQLNRRPASDLDEPKDSVSVTIWAHHRC